MSVYLTGYKLVDMEQTTNMLSVLCKDARLSPTIKLHILDAILI